jgi:hypothetical protein
LTKKETKHWSGKPSDPEFQNYTKNSFAEVFKQTAYKVTYPDGDFEYWNEIDSDEVKRLESIHKKKLVIREIEPVFEKGYPSYKAVNNKPKEK